MRRNVTNLEGERQRIGRELHDEIGQRLTGILLQLGRIQAEAPDMLQLRINAVQNQTRATLDAVQPLLKSADSNVALEQQFKGLPPPGAWAP